MIDSNYLIINRQPHRFKDMRIAGHTAVFTDEAGRIIDYGAVSLGESVYAALCCDEVRNVTLVTDRPGMQEVITILWMTEEGYRSGLEALKKVLHMHFSPQNKKLNRYAEAVAEKLALGVKLRITDAVSASDMVECPECGMLNPAGSQYCFDCGAEIS